NRETEYELSCFRRRHLERTAQPERPQRQAVVDGERAIEEDAAERRRPVRVDVHERTIHRLDRDEAQAVVDEVAGHVGQHDQTRSQPQSPDHAVHPRLCFKALTSRRTRLARSAPAGGRGGIRTHEGLAPLAVFKTAALNHSATLPYFEIT